MVNAENLINEMAKLMEINALNMIALHFLRRLHQYIRFRYARNYKETKKLVDSCYRVRSEPKLDGDGNPTGKTTKVWTEWDETEDPVEVELRGWLKIVPWQSQIRANSAHFVHKLYDMLVWIEKYVAEHPNTKGASLYTLLPVEDFLKNELNIVPTKKKTLGAQRPFAKPTFQKNRAEILRKVFDVQQFETSNRKFADEVKTNGYGASILLICPVTTTSVTVVGKKKTSSEKKSKIKTPEEIAEADSFAKDLFKLRADYSPDVLIGIDPGMRSLARLLTKVKRKEDESDIRLKSQPSKKEAKEIAEMAKFRNPKLADKTIVLKYTRNVLRCTNSSCKANFWSRDVNAARNMLELLSSGLKGKHGARRLRAFRRSK
ncbi:hypothetical protein PC121_g6436 [Phytophthora cactorum]|nr:hypothetical protein PC121_g6436 [Phytophthora cactorum]